MDTYSAAAAARALGTTAPRVLRAVDRLGMDASRGRGEALALTTVQLDALAIELGRGVPRGLTRVQARVLAALSRSPQGLASVRAVARRAGVSPTAAGHALRALSEDGLVRSEEQTLALGKATTVRVYFAAVGHPRWHELGAELASVTLPPLHRKPAKVVPYYLRHLFWNTAESQLNVWTSGPYIAKRLLTAGDLNGLAWGAVHLPPQAWERAAQARGLSPRDRALALNLARNDDARTLVAIGPMAITTRSPGTLNAVFSRTKVQFLHADEINPRYLLGEPMQVAGIRVADLDDLFAMKLKVIGDRGELRDYFDLMVIEQRTGRTVEEGMQLFLQRYQPQYPQQALGHIVRGLGYFDDVEPDELLPIGRQAVVDYWGNRHRAVVAALAQFPDTSV
jgi:DNA-binding transcriptional ArsR family regulator